MVPDQARHAARCAVSPRREEGFTLIELLVVICGIVAVVGCIVLGVFGCMCCTKIDTQRAKTNYSECVQSCAQLEGQEAEAECIKHCE